MIHVVAPPRTRLLKTEPCAITQRTIGLIAALAQLDRVRVYANAGSESAAHEQVDVLAAPPFVDDWFYKRLDEVYAPAPNDVVVHTWPRKPNDTFLSRRTIHIEGGVGYDFPPWGAFRIYESEAWRHFLWGKYGSTLSDRQNSWVISWPFEAADWPAAELPRLYVSFLARLIPDKGFALLKEVARRMPGTKFKIAGTGYAGKGWPPNVELVGPVNGSDRVDFLSRSIAHLCPTEYVEPLNGSAIEAMLCGTPVLASDWGGFTETVIEDVTGWRCSTVDEYVSALYRTVSIDRAACRRSAIDRFSIETAVPKYRRVLERLRR